MKFTSCLSLLLWLGLTATAGAQVPNGDAAAPSTTATDLTITPRIGGSVSTSGSGTPRFTQLEALVPVWQDPGSALTFVEARLLWLDYATLGTNLVLGQRFFDAAGDRLLGGYLAYDTRDTGNNRFHQIGLGFERLSDTWDLRLNGSFPVGDAEQSVGGAAALGTSNLRFERNFLLFDETRPLEVALRSIDGEAGGKITELGDFGELRGYGGLYWLDGGETSVVGWRARLEARAQERYTLGLAVQDDNRFGTNVVFQFGVSFGGLPQGVPREEVSPTYRRAGDFVARNDTIVVDEQTEAVATTARNPATGEPWTFQHVGNTGGSEGDGTFENPFGTVAAGIGAADSNGTDNQNEIVYVQFGNNPTNPAAITIPDNIQLLSIAPIQTINTQLGTVQLPLSGAGTSQRPQLNATVTMGNGTVLSGFDINNVAGNGVFAANVTGYTIAENTIRTTTDYGIRAGVDDGSSIGGITIQNNTLSDIGGGSGSTQNRFDAIFVGASGGSTITDVTIAGNTISNVDNDGIAIGATQASTFSRGIITGNTVSNVGRFGIGVGVDSPIPGLGLGAAAGSNVANVQITSNTLDGGGQKANAGALGANVGIAVQSATSQVCFDLASNTLINPPALGLVGVPNLQIFLQNGVVGPVPGNFDIVGGNNVAAIQSRNNNFTGAVQMYIPVPAVLGDPNSNSVASCP
ncbi:MAG: hypothetical protein HC910_06300 [Spirulinaceae cyanobacterium SM2_1_0]|nr:hypothetical protein [Spirulinaceae cyanobacterium SM2_1_0]